MSKLVRKSFTLPPQLVRDLDFIRRRVGVSQSALLAGVCSEPLHDLRSLLEQFPELDSRAAQVRFRGESIGIVRARMTELESLLGAVDGAGKGGDDDSRH